MSLCFHSTFALADATIIHLNLDVNARPYIREKNGTFAGLGKTLLHAANELHHANKVETLYHDNGLILTPIISPQSG